MSGHVCGTVLVGQGADAWDPECLLEPGHDGPCSPERRCENPDCHRPLDAERVLKRNAKTCDDRCRAAAWKARTNYGRHDRVSGSSPSGSSPRLSKAPHGGSRKRSGAQVSFRRAVEVVAQALAWDYGERDATAKAERVLRAALSERQRQQFDARRHA